MQRVPAATPGTCTEGVCSSQSGVGSASNSNQVLSAAVPPPGGSLLKANVLSASSTSTVNSTNTATDTGVAESAGVNVVSGLVTADVVRGVATAQASGFNSSFSAAGSPLQNLVVNGVAMNNVNPTTPITPPATPF